MRTLAILGLLLAGSVTVTHAQRVADSTAVYQTVKEYVEAYYAADHARMERTLHPDLMRRSVRADSTGRTSSSISGGLALVQMTRSGAGSRLEAARRRQDVVVLDVGRHAASAKLVGAYWTDHLHLARWDGRWVIVNILWEPTAG